MKPFGPLLLSVILLSSVGCRRYGVTTTTHEFPEERVAMAPAATAVEWIDRMEKNHSRWRVDLDELYAELPPQAEWATLTKRLRSDDVNVEGTLHPKLHFFADALSNDPAAVQSSFRAMLLAKKAEISPYDLERLPGYLAAFSKDQEEAKKWLTEHFPKSQEPKEPYKYETSEASKLLARNKIDEALVLLWKEATESKYAHERIRILGQLLEIGRLTERKDLYDKAFGKLAEITFATKPEDAWGTYSYQSYIAELIRLKDWGTLLKLGQRFENSRNGAIGFLAIKLAAIHQQDGAQAFMNELADAPKLGIGDETAYLKLLTEEIPGLPSIGELAVRALHAAGNKDHARITLFYLLAIKEGNDPLFRLSVELFPEESPAYFQQLQVYNPYEERPLIWLADLALKNGDTEGAQKLIDEAIALDPSDGEQGKDTRMQAYDVLSRILRAKGDSEKADFFNNVMLAIRRGEAADDFLNAGLIDEAIRRYQEALGSFQDAYCLQSRLAKTLMKAGKFEEAKPHFEKAFELMPVSFGPVESHCFGCERIFEDPRVQAIAQAAFRRSIADKPGNPRTHYLLGLLLEETGSIPEAIISYKKAIELDPGYYNCALRLHTLLAKDPARQAEANQVMELLRKISPYPLIANHFRARTDLAQTWIDAQNPPPNPLKLPPLPLPFSPSNKPAKDDRYSSHSGPIQAVDGWTADELLRDNEFLRWLDLL